MAQQGNGRDGKQPNFIDVNGSHVWVSQELLKLQYADIGWTKEWLAGRLDDKPTSQPGRIMLVVSWEHHLMITGNCLLATRQTKQTGSEEADSRDSAISDHAKAHEGSQNACHPLKFAQKPLVTLQKSISFQPSILERYFESRTNTHFSQPVQTSVSTSQKSPCSFFTFADPQPVPSVLPKTTATQLSKLESLAPPEFLPKDVPQDNDTISKRKWESYGGLDMEGEFTKDGRFEYLGHKH